MTDLERLPGWVQRPDDRPGWEATYVAVSEYGKVVRIEGMRWFRDEPEEITLLDDIERRTAVLVAALRRIAGGGYAGASHIAAEALRETTTEDDPFAALRDLVKFEE